MKRKKTYCVSVLLAIFSVFATAVGVYAQEATATPGEEVTGTGPMGVAGLIIYIVFIVGIMYLLIFLPQKKRDKKMKEMVNSLKVGDKVVTIGGVSGKVVNIKDDEVIIETGVEKTKIALKNWAIKEIDKPLEA